VNELFKIYVAQPRRVIKYLDISVSNTARHHDYYTNYARLSFSCSFDCVGWPMCGFTAAVIHTCNLH